MRNFAMIFVVFMTWSFFNLNMASAQPAPQPQPAGVSVVVTPPTVEDIGSCTKTSNMKEGLTCCEAAKGRETQCRRVVRTFFDEKIRKEIISKLDDAAEYKPTPVGECVIKGQEKSAVQCCTELKGHTLQARCLEQVMASVQSGKIVPATDDDFRASERKRELEELDSRTVALGLITTLKFKIFNGKDSIYERLGSVSKTLKDLPADLRKEFGEMLTTAVTESEKKCVETIVAIQSALSSRIDELEDRIDVIDERGKANTAKIEAFQSRANPTVQVGGWFAGDKVGGFGGLRLDLVLEWEKFHFQLGGGVGASPSGLAWMADALMFVEVNKYFSLGGGLLAEADASDLAETDHALLGATPALQVHYGKFIFEASLPVGGLVRPGGKWEFSVGGVASAMYRF